MSRPGWREKSVAIYSRAMLAFQARCCKIVTLLDALTNIREIRRRQHISASDLELEIPEQMRDGVGVMPYQFPTAR
jgi:hypothetical protein